MNEFSNVIENIINHNFYNPNDFIINDYITNIKTLLEDLYYIELDIQNYNTDNCNTNNNIIYYKYKDKNELVDHKCKYKNTIMKLRYEIKNAYYYLNEICVNKPKTKSISDKSIKKDKYKLFKLYRK